MSTIIAITQENYCVLKTFLLGDLEMKALDVIPKEGKVSGGEDAPCGDPLVSHKRLCSADKNRAGFRVRESLTQGRGLQRGLFLSGFQN